MCVCLDYFAIKSLRLGVFFALVLLCLDVYVKMLTCLGLCVHMRACAKVCVRA